MPNIVSRRDAEALIQEQVVSTIFQDTPKQSVFMSLARKLPNMTSKQTRIPVLDVLPLAYWVNGDTGIKSTDKQAWDNVYLTAGELAVIVPIPEAVVDDADFDIVGEITPRVIEAIGKCVDGAIFFGTNRPSEWQNDIITLARQAGNNVDTDANLTYDNLLGVDGLIGKVEAGGFMVNGVVAAMNTRAQLRGIKDQVSNPIFKTDMQGATPYALDGAPMYFPTNGSFDTAVARMIAGDFSQAVYSIRQDVTVKILDQATIIDPSTKAVIYSLAQQDMIALRVVFRMGWAVPNPATRMNENRVYVPFAYLEAATPITTYTQTFTVSDSDGVLEGVRVDVDGARLVTNPSGVAVFNLRPGTYNYKASKSGYKPVTGSFTIANAALTQTVTLVSNS